MSFFPLFQYIIFFLIFFFHWPVKSIIYEPDATTVLVVISFVCILLSFLNNTQSFWKSLIILLFIALIGIYFDNRTLSVSIIIFLIIKTLGLITSLDVTKKHVFYSVFYPASLIFIVIYFGNIIQNPSILGFRDYIWASAILGSEFANQNYVLPTDINYNAYVSNLMMNNVHNNFVGLFSRLNIFTALGSWALIYYIVKSSFKEYLNSWRVQISLFILFSQTLFTGRSFFSLDDFSIVFWIGLFGLNSYKNFNNIKIIS